MSSELISAMGQSTRVVKVGYEDYVCITDIARFKNPMFLADVVKTWMRSKNTVAYLGLWEQLNNPNPKVVEFDQFVNYAILCTNETTLKRNNANCNTNFPPAA